MSVLIKGIKMPKSCLQCGACIEGDCDFCYCGYDQDEREIELKFNYRPKWCPLVEAVEQPVKLGEWIDDGCITKCDQCGEQKGFPHWKFCPNCGADMRGELNG